MTVIHLLTMFALILKETNVQNQVEILYGLCVATPPEIGAQLEL